MNITNIKPYTPIPYRKGNTLLRNYKEGFIDKVGNRAIINYVDFKDSKGRIVLNYVMQIKWG